MQPDPHHTYTAFIGARRLATGALDAVALALLRAKERSAAVMPLVFSDPTGSQVELDLRGGEEGVVKRYQRAATRSSDPAGEGAPPRTRGRPRMGVVAREVTLLPEHWEWLASQPGGASVVLRKLVHQEIRAGAGRERMRRAQERSYKVMVSLAGDRPGFEEAARALFAGDLERLRSLAAEWPRDIGEHVLLLADPEHDPTLSLQGGAP